MSVKALNFKREEIDFGRVLTPPQRFGIWNMLEQHRSKDKGHLCKLK